jgi:hypothetical protein
MNRRVATSGGVLAGVLLSVLAGCAEEATTGEGDEGDRVEAVAQPPAGEADEAGEAGDSEPAAKAPSVVVRPQNDGRMFDSQNNSHG